MDYISWYGTHGVEDLKKAGRQYLGWCPFHLDKGGKHKGFSVNPDSGTWFCFSCNEGGNAIIFCRKRGLDVKQAPDYDPHYSRYSYGGGVERRKPIKKDTGKEGWKGTDGNINGVGPYNDQAIDQAREQKKVLWICEGEKDTLTMMEAGELAIGIPSATSDKVLDGISLDGIPEVVIACDNDEAGGRATERILKRFPWALKIEWPGDKAGGFDVTDLKNEAREGFVEILKGWTVGPVKQYTVEMMTADIRGTPEGLDTGYESLDELFKIPQGAITIVAGRPSHGKTSFLLNLFLKMIAKNPDRHFFFFSYEEAVKRIGVKLVAILSNETVLDSSHNIDRIEQYIKTRGDKGHSNIDDIEGGIETLATEIGAKRLWMIGESYYVDELVGVLNLLSEQHPIGAVFIDYIQKVKNKDRHSTRQLELQKTIEAIHESAKTLSIPIIMGCQLGREKDRKDKVRLDNMREAGDIENEAHLVLGLHNPAMEKAQDEGVELPDPEVGLRVTVLKNRSGPVNVERELRFFTPTLLIKEPEPGKFY